MSEIKIRKRIALEIAYSISPEAQLSSATSPFGKKLYNGLSLDDCRALCAAADAAFVREGNVKTARAVHEVPLFVFAMLSKEKIKDFISVWMSGGKGSEA